MPKNGCETKRATSRPGPIPEGTALYRVLDAVAKAVADQLIDEHELGSEFDESVEDRPK